MRSREERILSHAGTVLQIAELERATSNRIDGESVGWVAVIEAVDEGVTDDATVARRVRNAIRREYKRLPKLVQCDETQLPQREACDDATPRPTELPEDAASRLPPYQRRIAAMVVKGFKVSQIANLLGHSEQYIRTVVYDTAKTLRERKTQSCDRKTFRRSSTRPIVLLNRAT